MHQSQKTTEVCIHDLEADYGVADIFDSMTNAIAYNLAYETINKKADTHNSIGLVA